MLTTFSGTAGGQLRLVSLYYVILISRANFSNKPILRNIDITHERKTVLHLQKRDLRVFVYETVLTQQRKYPN
jgi:hypothetical protein